MIYDRLNHYFRNHHFRIHWRREKNVLFIINWIEQNYLQTQSKLAINFLHNYKFEYVTMLTIIMHGHLDWYIGKHGIQTIKQIHLSRQNPPAFIWIKFDGSLNEKSIWLEIGKPSLSSVQKVAREESWNASQSPDSPPFPLVDMSHSNI